MSTDIRLMTAADLLRMPRGKFRYELVKGELHAMSPAGSAHGAVTQRLSTLLDQYVAGNGLGLVFGAETGFLVDRNPDTVRAPDIAFVRRDRISADGPPDGYWQGAPDLAVEVASPGDTPREIEQKVSEWFDAGCHLVWVIRPRLKTLAIHRAGDEPEILAGDATLDGAPVLAGFCCQLADVFSVIRGP